MRTFLCSILLLLCGNTMSCVSQLDGFNGSDPPDDEGAPPDVSAASCLDESCASVDEDSDALGERDAGEPGSCPAGSARFGAAPSTTAVTGTALTGMTGSDAFTETTGAAALEDDAAVPSETADLPPSVSADGSLPASATTVDARAGESADCVPCVHGQYCPGGDLPAEECGAGTWDDDSDPATACIALSQCEAGAYISVPGHSVSDVVVSDVVCAPCGEGSFSMTLNASECTRWQTCEPGSYISQTGSATQDVTCEGCPSGRYSDAADAATCVAWTTCQPGQYVVAAGSPTADRSCASCPEGQDSEGINVGSCAASGQCPAGTVETAPATDTVDAVCAVCARGTYCAGGTAEAVPCAPGTWDDDADPATPCVSKTVCVPGQALESEGSTTADRTCEACASETFSSEINAIVCQPWSTCPAGTYVSAGGTTTLDRACSACPPGHFSDRADAPTCAPHTTCVAPDAYQRTAPSPAMDRECGLCAAPERTAADNDDACSLPAFPMTNGRVVIEAEHYHAQTNNGSPVNWSELSNGASSGERCMELGPDDGGYFWTTNVTTTAPRLDYHVNFTSTGTFYLFLRGSAGARPDGTSDSAYAGINGAPLDYDFDEAAELWDWRSQPVTVNRTGIHTVSIWGREDGFRADKLVLQTSPVALTGLGPPESSAP